MKGQRLHLQFSTCYERLRTLIDTYNAGCTSREERITGGMRGTLETMLRLYIKQVSGRVLAGAPLPGFLTNNQSLGVMRGSSPRTIINHRRRFVKAGIIVREEQQGCRGLRLWFAPSITASTHEMIPLPGDVTMCIPSDVHPATAKTFHTLVHEHHELKNNNRNVDKWISPGTDLQDEKKVMNTTEKGLGEKKKPPSSLSPTLSNLWMVANFWLRARARLYPHEAFEEQSVREIKNFIWETVYLKFHGDRNWQAHHQVAICRLEMVHRWLQRKPKRWIPIPEIYFDPLNQTNGFNNTWKWYLKAQVLKRRISEQITFRGMQSEWIQLDKGLLSTTPLKLLRNQQAQLTRSTSEAQRAYLQLLHRRLTRLKDDP